MTSKDQESRSTEIWKKISNHLRDEIDEVVYGPWLSALGFVECAGNVLRLSHTSAFRRDWVINTYEEFILALWRKQDDSITELEIIIRPRVKAEDGEQANEPVKVAVKPRPIVISARDSQPIAPLATDTSVMDPADKSAERAAIRKRIGKVGVWSRSPYFYEAQQATDLAKEAEDLGFGSLWIPGFDGGHVFDRCRMAMEATSTLTIATGVVNIWRHEPKDVAETVAKMRADNGDRFLLGMGSSHRFLVGPEEYDKVSPMKKMRNYLADLDDAGLPESHRVLGALGPKMLALGAERTAGAHPTFIPPEFTGATREIIGEDALLMPEVTVILDDNPETARAYARRFASLYFKGPNYANMLRRFGFTDEDFEGEGSDHLIDSVVAWGDPESIAARVHAHLDAGADHVAIQYRGYEPELEAWRKLAPLLLDY